MSLEATHIRFALDLQNKYNIRDISQYISGATYQEVVERRIKDKF